MERGNKKTQDGQVVRNQMDKTVVVQITTQVMHPTYRKYVRRTKRYLAHDETNQCNVGDVVRLIETRPLSKRKRWRVQSVLSRAS